MKKKDLKFLIIFIIVVIICLIYLFQSSYAKYRKQINANINSSIASWNIKINDEYINNKSTLTNDIQTTFLGDNYTKEGVLAPGSEGYFDIIIDATNTDVSFNYTIHCIVSTASDITDLITTGYIINPSSTNTTKITYDNTTGISGSVTHNTSQETIRIYIKWNEDATSTMDNTADTTTAIDTNSKALMTSTIAFNQLNN